MRGVRVALLALAAGSCGGGWEWKTPERVDAERLAELLRPRGAERLVLANFWATW